MSEPIYVLGIDGGGSSTVAWLADGTGKVIGRGVSGPSNAKSAGTSNALRALDRAASLARAEADQTGDLDAVCLGVAGFDRADDREFLHSWGNQTLGARRVLIVNDGELVIAAGLEQGFGVAVISGTGSIAVAQDREGQRHRAGGWGHLFGDEGSGYKLVMDALRLVARRADGRDPRPDPDRFSDAMCAALGVQTPEQIVTAAYRPEMTRAKLAALAPATIAACALEPDLMQRLIVGAGEELAETVAAAARKIGCDRGPLPLALAGSLLVKTPLLADVLLAALSRRDYQPQVTRVDEPALGAVRLALAEAQARGAETT